MFRSSPHRRPAKTLAQAGGSADQFAYFTTTETWRSAMAKSKSAGDNPEAEPETRHDTA